MIHYKWWIILSPAASLYKNLDQMCFQEILVTFIRELKIEYATTKPLSTKPLFCMPQTVHLFLFCIDSPDKAAGVILFPPASEGWGRWYFKFLCQSTPGRRYPHPSWLRGTPFSPDGGGTPILPDGGYPHTACQGGVLPSRHDWNTPIGTWWGYPLSGDRAEERALATR